MINCTLLKLITATNQKIPEWKIEVNKMTEHSHNMCAQKRLIFRKCILNNSPTNQKEKDQQPTWKSKVGKKSEQVLYKGEYSNGQSSSVKVLNIYRL